MRNSKYLIFCIYIVGMFFSQCGNSSGNGDEVRQDSLLTAGDEKIEVSVIPLKRATFYGETVSNGKLKAVRKADLCFKVAETINRIDVKNGSYVQENQLIASLDNFLLRNVFLKAKQNVERSRLELQDQLIMQGFTDTTKIPREMLKSLRIRSGYEDALSELELAQYNLANSEIRVPFAGIIANLETKVKNRSVVGSTFCTLIDDSEFDAEFPVLETELKLVKENQKVKIIPFSLDSIVFSGTLSEINPVINENGLVKLKARVKNSARKLFEGMNVKVLLGNAFTSCLVVPKQAVVMRQGKQVVFTYEDGRAKWNYVKTGFENSSEYTILEGLKEGDLIIVSNNLNLGHDAEVAVEE